MLGSFNIEQVVQTVCYNEDTLESLPLNVRDQTLMHVQEENKRKKRKEKKRKRNKTKKKKQKLDKMKRENKINIIIYTRIYLPGNDTKNLTRPKS